MPLYSLGVNHTSAPLALRERVCIVPDLLPEALHQLVKTKPAAEAAILSTCNRTEIYCQTEEPEAISQWLADFHHLNPTELLPHIYVHPQQEAVRHAFRVASGLDSMVLGEPQIFGQIKHAARVAQHAGTMGTLLHRLFQRTFAVAKEVRTTTDIGAHVVSVAVAAVRLTQHILGELAHHRALFVGAGEMIGLCLNHYAGQGLTDITIANRSLPRAQQLAARHQAKIMALDEITSRLSEFDVVVSCTASPLPIFGLGAVDEAMKKRRHRLMVMVDLAMPRDIEEQVGQRDDVFLYTLERLAELANEGMENRQAAAQAAEGIVNSRVHSFMQWMESRQNMPTLLALRQQGEEMRQMALRDALRRLTHGEAPETVIEELSRTLTNKLLHVPTQALNQVDDEARATLISLLERLYSLPASRRK